MSTMITIAGIRFSKAAAECIEEAGVDVQDDLTALIRGDYSGSSLLAKCLDGADPNRVGGWTEYVDRLLDAADSSRLGDLLPRD